MDTAVPGGNPCSGPSARSLAVTVPWAWTIVSRALAGRRSMIHGMKNDPLGSMPLPPMLRPSAEIAFAEYR